MTICLLCVRRLYNRLRIVVFSVAFDLSRTARRLFSPSKLMLTLWHLHFHLSLFPMLSSHRKVNDLPVEIKGWKEPPSLHFLRQLLDPDVEMMSSTDRARSSTPTTTECMAGKSPQNWYGCQVCPENNASNFQTRADLHLHQRHTHLGPHLPYH